MVTAVWRLGITPCIRPARTVVFQEAGTITKSQQTARAALVL